MKRKRKLDETDGHSAAMLMRAATNILQGMHFIVVGADVGIQLAWRWQGGVEVGMCWGGKGGTVG
jgi:hypothetical protein